MRDKYIKKHVMFNSFLKSYILINYEFIYKIYYYVILFNVQFCLRPKKYNFKIEVFFIIIL